MRIILSTICLMFLMSGITSAFFEEKKSIRILYVIVSMTGVILCVIGFIYADTVLNTAVEINNSFLRFMGNV